MNKALAQSGFSIRQFRPWQALVLLFLAVGLVYSNSLDGPFIFDDTESILENPHIRALWPLSGALTAPPQSSVAGRPVAALSLALNYAISEYRVWSWHAFNFAIHALAAAVLFGLVRRTLRSPAMEQRFGEDATTLAFVTAAVWALHPLQTAAVTYIIQRAESMMGLFYLLTLYAAARVCGGGRRWTLAAVLSCAAGMATKEVMATAPLVALLYDRCFFAGSLRVALRRRWWLHGALAATWAILIALNAGGPRSKSAGFGLETVSAAGYLLTQFDVVAHYLLLSFWPARLCLDYQWPIAGGIADVWPEMLLVGGLAIASLWGLARNRPWGFIGASFFLILAPTSSIVPLVDAAFEHRMYLPLACVVALTIAWAQRAMQMATASRKDGSATPAAAIGGASRSPLATAVALAVIAALAVRTYLRNEDYASAETIWRSVLDVRPDNPRAHVNLAIALEQRQALDEAISHYRAALESGAFSAHVHANFADALRRSGRRGEAMKHLRLAVQVDPTLPAAHVNLGNALLDEGDLDGAIGSYREATRLAPHDHIAWFNLGMALRKAGRLGDAAAAFETATRERSDIAEGFYMLGLTELELGRPSDAARRLEQAVALRGDWPAALDRLAWIRATSWDASLRDAREAVALAQRSVGLSMRQNARYLDTLAAALAANGEFAEATATIEEALRLLHAAGADNVAAQTAAMQLRRDLYRRGRPHIETAPASP